MALLIGAIVAVTLIALLDRAEPREGGKMMEKKAKGESSFGGEKPPSSK